MQGIKELRVYLRGTWNECRVKRTETWNAGCIGEVLVTQFCIHGRQRNTVLFKGEAVRNMPGIPPLGFSFDGINL